MQGQICDILRPQLAMNRFLPIWPHRFPHFGYIHRGGRGVGGSLILDRCRAFDLFASVDAHANELLTKVAVPYSLFPDPDQAFLKSIDTGTESDSEEWAQHLEENIYSVVYFITF